MEYQLPYKSTRIHVGRMHFFGYLLSVFIVLISGCTPEVTYPQREIDYLEAGITLSKAGDHLNAGYWFEAALEQHPDQESRILRLLVEEQILAGRFLAAQSGLERLTEISGNDPAIEELTAAIQISTNHDTYRTYEEVIP